MAWNPEVMPDQTGKIILITGANSGIGLEAAKWLAGKGAQLILACRDPVRAGQAAEQVRAVTGSGPVSVVPLDLADLTSVHACVSQVAEQVSRLDVLINNAGLMAPPLGRTRDGFEMQFGTNHLGHFALTGLLLPLLEAAPAARVVTVSSIAHRIGGIRFDDLNWHKRYSAWGAYGQSKLSNLIFARDLNRRLEAAGSTVRSYAVHPGYSATHLQDQMFAGKILNAVFAQSQKQGSLPTVYAATAADVEPGGYYGPQGFMEYRGLPGPASLRRLARNPAVAQRLWQESEKLTGTRYLSSL